MKKITVNEECINKGKCFHVYSDQKYFTKLRYIAYINLKNKNNN